MHARRYFVSPLGDILILASEKGITHVLFTNAAREEEIPNEITEQCLRELDEYFFKGRKFFDVELDVHVPAPPRSRSLYSVQCRDSVGQWRCSGVRRPGTSQWKL